MSIKLWHKIHADADCEIYRYEDENGIWLELLYINQRDTWEGVRCNIDEKEAGWEAIEPVHTFEAAKRAAFDYIKRIGALGYD